MKTLEQKQAEIMKRAEEEIENAKIQCAVMGKLPLQPNYVHPYNLYGSHGSIVYDVKTRQEAIDIYKMFTVNPSFLCRNGSVAVKAFDDDTAKDVTELHAYFEIGTYNAELKFYTTINNEIWRISIQMPVNLFGNFYKDNPKARTNYKLLFNPSPLLRETQRLVNYAGGSYYGNGSFGGQIWGMFEPYEVIRQLESEV